ncbi:efflux RND transporter periplasmic adaptor subunit [Shewanella surugensis]|uniref:Efflux RND transporter periplasmic adaptor subunit n=1 Tax=Shewanella surugensis TaxID=212020 RepID=A0ABT0L6D9_9GAMM|nr:efflux RND transporter periplasmic adaptor subunit [Shewanella surugensis]MCL1122937.1 efflux RND transporter periplasmic adaptor subunit [Shewanella surugensis]
MPYTRFNISRTLWLTLLSCLLFAAMTFSVYSQANETDENAKHNEHEESEGPHGGKLLHFDDFEIEITLYETGVPPEMRIYAYQNGQTVDPNQVDINVTLNRLGEHQNQLTFTPEKDYLVSQQVVTEPHSFTVDVNARYNKQVFEWQYDSFEGRTEISDRLLNLSNVETEKAGEQRLTFTEQLFGIVAPIKDKLFNINAPYAGIIDQMHVSIGDHIKKEQVIASVINSDTLRRYQIKSPTEGQITAQNLNKGDHTANAPLVSISDLSSVWIELSAFPSHMEKLKVGLAVNVFDDHNEEKVTTKISYISPMMTGGHIARARAVIENTQGHWRPGMHIKAEIETATKTSPVAVNVDAIQTFRGGPVVFAKYGNTFEVRMLTLGESDGQYVEVINGLAPGIEYVTQNSFLIKADILKNAAKHQH